MENQKLEKSNEKLSVSISRKISTAPYESIDLQLFDSWEVEANLSEEELKQEFDKKLEFLKQILREQENLIKRKT